MSNCDSSALSSRDAEGSLCRSEEVSSSGMPEWMPPPVRSERGAGPGDRPPICRKLATLIKLGEGTSSGESRACMSAGSKDGLCCAWRSGEGSSCGDFDR
jgi:hypothetical protein